MRRLEATLAAVGVALAVTGCLSTFPLEPAPANPIDPKLTGVWRCLPSDEDATAEVATLTIRRATDRTYAVTFQAMDEDASRYDAYTTKVGRATLVNLREVDAEGSPWDYARYSFLLPDVLQVRMVQETLLRNVERTPASFREAIRRHLDDPALYGDFCICVRAKEKEPAAQ